MNPSRALRRPEPALLLAVFGLMVACDRSPAAPVDPAPAAPPSAAPPGPRIEDAAFRIELRATAPLRQGVAGGAEIVIEPRGEYHSNAEYPYKFRPSRSPGVAYASAQFSGAAVTVTPARTTLRVELTPATKGPATLGGQLSFSVCSDARCLVEKRELALPVEVE
ncbi:MAG: hypothetical protein FJ104_16045 [Deltaproteobacteria bacterium]|nr:hypothetical protein [Deltaproteobacteria bacterium]